jgi:hypothetical protein
MENRRKACELELYGGTPAMPQPCGPTPPSSGSPRLPVCGRCGRRGFGSNRGDQRRGGDRSMLLAVREAPERAKAMAVAMPQTVK